jgi:hypothetical protein
MDSSREDFFGKRKMLGYLELKTSFDINFSKGMALSNTYRILPINGRNYKGNYYQNDFYARDDYLERKIYFKGYDLLAEELYMNFYTADAQFGVGKFNTSHGLAHSRDKYSGIGGNYFAEGYALNEVMGGFVKINLPFLVFNVSAFYRDVGFLSNSLLGERKTLKKNTMAAANEKFNNFAVSGEFALRDWKVNLAFRRLAAANSDQNAEKAYLAGVERVFEYYNGVTFVPFAEYNLTENYGGLIGRRLYYLTVNAPFLYDNWCFLFTLGTKYDKDKNLDQSNTSYLAEANIGYKIQEHILIDISRVMGREYKNIFPNATKKSKNDLDSWNIRISYVADFREDTK